ncbi:MAG TPA: sigma 54-interacting transcriptional regulator [Polyangia bacterium]|nr:sigma 54-interacting transcriptional regulator [Polyangia bacterium]
MITPNESITFVPRHEASDDPVKVPLLLIVGNSQGQVPRGTDRLITFTGSLIVGRKEISQGEPGQASLILADRMISSQHLAITRAPEDGVFEVTDLSSTNGTIVDGEPVETSVRLRDGSVIFVGSYVMVFRVATMAELAAIQAELQHPLGPVATVNPAFATICRKLRKLAEAGEEMLLTGETGAGKEVYANAIHRASGRTGRFVAINCAAIPRELVETELFGYARGAHSQAAMAKQGIIEQAEGGTLLLDEIGEMAPELQTKLLRFTQDRLLAPVGGLRSRRIETRIIAATSRTAAPSQSGSLGLRSDLAARLGAEPIRIPPLRDRIEDLGALASYLLGDRNKPLELSAFQVLCLYPWPGNVRELGKVVTSAEALARDADRIALEHLPVAFIAAPKIRSSAGRRKSRPPPSAVELEGMMRRFRGNMLRVARELDRKPALVYRWAKRFGLNADEFRAKTEA